MYHPSVYHSDERRITAFFPSRCGNTSMSSLSLFTIAMFYKVIMNTELANTKQLTAPGENTGLDSFKILLTTFFSTPKCQHFY